ncbi:MAG: sulfur reduction protein DsrS, partial [Gammaproteobacteria bacterium]|nr:sulfur reduction protein DsrS [Gammaproteobacteria bacterium]
MDLTPEDALRINVLLASQIEAIRLDESRMTLFALSQKGEAKVKLNPNCRDDSYLRKVRETLSSHVLGSPGGYPVYLKRWTRMGQARDEVLESLLMLGEPEAVVAVVNATGITDELARRAWWASQTSDNARCMLQQAAVVNGEMGPVLADFLIEFLPFEEDASSQIKTVSLVLQSDLVAEDVRTRLWEKGRLKNSYLV